MGIRIFGEEYAILSERRDCPGPSVGEAEHLDTSDVCISNVAPQLSSVQAVDVTKRTLAWKWSFGVKRYPLWATFPVILELRAFCFCKRLTIPDAAVSFKIRYETLISEPVSTAHFHWTVERGSIRRDSIYENHHFREQK